MRTRHGGERLRRHGRAARAPRRISRAARPCAVAGLSKARGAEARRTGVLGGHVFILVSQATSFGYIVNNLYLLTASDDPLAARGIPMRFTSRLILCAVVPAGLFVLALTSNPEGREVQHVGEGSAGGLGPARRLPALMVTLAPEAATPEQIATLSGAGAIVSLGHSDCDYDTARAAFEAGASCATHLFNAMSQLGHRTPGLVGAILSGHARAGLIADGIHVHPAAMRTTLAARPEGIFLVTDCMAFAGTDLTEMELNGRQVLRRDGRLIASVRARAHETDWDIGRLMVAADQDPALGVVHDSPGDRLGHGVFVGGVNLRGKARTVEELQVC